jgi:hypothetical protein
MAGNFLDNLSSSFLYSHNILGALDLILTLCHL